MRIIARLNIGGPAIHTILLTNGLNKEKYESILVTGVVSSNEGDMSYLADEKGIAPIMINELGREISWQDDLIALWKIFRLLRKENPDIVHTHTAKAGTLGRLAVLIYNSLSLLKNKIFKVQSLIFSKQEQKQDQRIKLIHTFHGHIFHGYFGSLKTKIFIIIEMILAWFTDRIIAISSVQAAEIKDNLHIATPERITTVSLGLNLDKYLNNTAKGGSFREKWCVSNSTVFVGSIGRLVPVKNHKMFLESAKIMKEKKSAIDVRFIIVGGGELREDLFSHAIRLDIQDDVIFTGWQKEMSAIYTSLDLVALTSLNEGTPVSLIEAMAAGKAVVSTKVGGVVDLMGEFIEKLNSDNKIEIYDNGILVESGDTIAFVEAMSLLIKDEGLRDNMGANGREYVKNRFNIDRLVKDMEKLYESL